MPSITKITSSEAIKAIEAEHSTVGHVRINNLKRIKVHSDLLFAQHDSRIAAKIA